MRQKSFNENEVIQRFGEVFAKKGYESTSLDDLVKKTGILRGSLYNSFGSKENMFISALRKYLEEDVDKEIRDRLMLVAFYELSPKSKKIRNILVEYFGDADRHIEEQLGRLLVKFSKIKGTRNEKQGIY